MSAKSGQRREKLTRFARRTFAVLALQAIVWTPLPAGAEDQPPHMRGTVRGDGSTPPLGFRLSSDTALFVGFPTAFEVAFTPIERPLPKEGSVAFDEEVGSHSTPRLYELRSITNGKMFLNGNPAGHWRSEPYFRSTAIVTCPLNGTCAPEIDAKLYAKWGNVKGLVHITDGTPSPWTFPIYATPASPVPAGGESEFNTRWTSFNLVDGVFSFLPSQLYVGADPSWSPQCFPPTHTHACEAVPVDPANQWGLRVVGDGGVDGTKSKMLYSNGQGTFDWKITLSTKLKKEQIVQVRSSEWTPVLFELTLQDVFDLAEEQRELRDKSCNAPHPVSLITGNVFLDHTDVSLPGLYRDFEFTRHYNSIGGPVARGGIAVGSGPLGKGWTHSFSTNVEKISDYIYRIWQANGVPAYFTDPDEDGVFGLMGVTHHLETLRVTATGYTRAHREGGTEDFDTLGRLQRLTDRLGRVTTLSRDARGRLSTITSPEGRTLTLEYSGYDATIARLIGSAGVIAEYSYDRGRLSQVRYADGTGYRYSYSEHSQLTTVTDFQGVVLERHGYTYAQTIGAGDRPKAAWSELNNGTERHTFTYEEGRTLVTNAKGGVSTFEYSEKPSGRYITKITGCSFCGDNQGGTLVRDFDDDGRLRSYTDADLHTTTYEYTGPDLTAVIDALGRTTSYGGHDAYGRPGTITEPGRGTTTLTWSLEGLRSIELPGGETTTYTYVDQRLSRIDTAAGASYGFDITALGELRSMTDSRRKATSFTYDAMGRLETSTLPDGTTTRIVRDVRGRPTVIERADGKKARFAYDASGRLSERRDEAGELWRYSYDAYNRLQAVLDPLRGTTRLTFDTMSHPTSVTDAKGQRTEFVYDDFGRLIEMADPMDGTEEYTYYPGGRLKTRRDRKGTITTFTYDAIGRLTGKSYSDGTPPLSISYDDDARTVTLANATDTITQRYEPSGVLASEASVRNGSSVSYTYRGGYLRETAALDGLLVKYGYEGDFVRSLEAAGRSFGFTYDEHGRRKTLSYPNGLTTVSSYATHLPWLEELRLEGTAAGFDVAYTHDAVGNRLSKTVAGLAESYGYDPLDRLTRVDRTAPAPTTSLFGYDPVGNRTSQQIAGVSRTLSYDARNRLLSSEAGTSLRVTGTTSEPAVVTVQGQPARMLPGGAFEADAAGSGAQTTLTVTATDASGNTRTNTYEAISPGGSGSYSYDANGNLTGKTEAGVVWAYEWNAENQLLRVTRNGTEAARFAYDPLGRRVAKLAGGVTTSYTYDGMDILREAVDDGASTTSYRYIHGPGIDEPLARIDHAGQASYYHADGLGSIVRMTSQAGDIVQSRQYDAWGNPELGADLPGYAFTGREWDPETGLYYYRARYYDPKIGRFISEDPIGFQGGVNFYGYGRNNPTNFVDPSGLDSWFYSTTTKTLTYIGPTIQSWPAGTGPWGNGALPPGSYTVNGSPVTVPPSNPQQASYCDGAGNCWWQPITPNFPTTRTGLGIHPDGGTAGTAGCIGATGADTSDLRQQLTQTPGLSLTVGPGSLPNGPVSPPLPPALAWLVSLLR